MKKTYIAPSVEITEIRSDSIITAISGYFTVDKGGRLDFTDGLNYLEDLNSIHL